MKLIYRVIIGLWLVSQPSFSSGESAVSFGFYYRKYTKQMPEDQDAVEGVGYVTFTSPIECVRP